MGLKIGLITTWNVRCGIASYSKNLATALADCGVEVYIVRMPRFGYKTPELLEHVIRKVPVDDLDLVHVQHEYGIWGGLEGGWFAALKALKLPVVVTMHGVGNYPVDRVIADAADRVIVHNEYCRRRYVGDSTVIPHGCLPPVECPSEAECKRDLGIPDHPIVGYLGFVTPGKGLEYLIQAMQRVKKAALLVAGGYHTGDVTNYIQMLKEKSFALLPGRSQWIGYVEDAVLPTVYGAFRVLVYPSVAASESGALLMGLSHLRPTVASDLRPFREKRQVGALMTFRTVNGLSRTLRRLVEDDGARHKLQEGARRYVEANSWPNVAAKHLALYEDLT